jgi:formylmethanofuran dehydrogenase subunit E
VPHKDPEVRREYLRQYREKNRDAIVQRINEWKRSKYASDEAYREKVKAATRAVPKHVWQARQAVRTAIKQGRLQRPDSCEECGRVIFVEAAHKDYSRHLDIRWLCRTCHRKWDAADPKGCKP